MSLKGDLDEAQLALSFAGLYDHAARLRAHGNADYEGQIASTRQALDVKEALFKQAVAERDRLYLALAVIRELATEPTPGTLTDDLAVIANVADQALQGRVIEGDPGVYGIDVLVDRMATRESR